jgi:AcrR family transcriptional regulator
MRAMVRSARKPRQPGRPRQAAQADMRGTTLDAALKLFAARGIGATSLRDIARAAGVTPALLHYYFDSKPGLVDAVIAERLMPVVVQLRDALPAGAADSAALIAGFTRAAFALLDRHPWFPQLWVREVLCEGGALREMLVKRVAPLIPQQLARRFADAQACGELNAALDPRLLVVSLVGLTLFTAASAPIWRAVFRADDVDTETLRMHTMALLDRGALTASAKAS